jgi:hypothetical protein
MLALLAAVQKISYDDDAQHDFHTWLLLLSGGDGCAHNRIVAGNFRFEQHRTHPEATSRVGFLLDEKAEKPHIQERSCSCKSCSHSLDKHSGKNI